MASKKMLSRMFATAASAKTPSTVLMNGVRVDGKTAKVSIWDTTVQRGDGMFEVVRVRGDGQPVGLSLHIERLFKGAPALDFKIPASRSDIASWITSIASEGGEGSVRVLLTRGSVATSGGHLPGFNKDEHAPPTVVVMWQPMPAWPATMRLFPIKAWWHPAGSWQTVKWLSYGPNMMMSRMAVKAGYDDALLTSEQSVVLDGPTYAVGWFRKGVLETPSAQSLGLLPSCTLDLVFECAKDLGIRVNEGAFNIKDLASADEVFVTSSTKDVLPVSAIGDRAYHAGANTKALAQHFKKKYLDY